jgi:hypothetical protein
MTQETKTTSPTANTIATALLLMSGGDLALSADELAIASTAQVTVTTRLDGGVSLHVERCDACPALATTWAIDVTRNLAAERQGGWKAYIPHGPIKRGCSLHPVESREIETPEDAS